MKTLTRTLSTAALLALSATPALAAHGASDKPADPHRLAAPGQYCKAEPKTHVAGMSGTPFSACVKAQAKLRKGATDSARAACKGESKRHVKGVKGTPFSVCVKAGKQLVSDQAAQQQDDSSAS